MSRFVFNEAGMRYVFRREDGPTGRYVARKAAEVTTHAHHNAAGRPGPRIRSGELQSSIRFAGMFENVLGLFALVGSDAKSNDRHQFGYPVALELGGVTPQGKAYRYPWLIPALRSAFPRSQQLSSR